MMHKHQPPTIHHTDNHSDFNSVDDVKLWIKNTALELGFADCGFLSVYHPLFAKQTAALKQWLDEGYAGGLNFLYENHHLRANPHLLVDNAKTIISVRMDYLTDKPTPRTIADNERPNNAIIARYARGRDYHKTMRGKLKQLGKAIEAMLPQWTHLNIGADRGFVFRPFSDSAPIFERPIAEACGLGFTGKHTLLINQKTGSFFVLGELFISLELTAEHSTDNPTPSRCGSCRACIDICPTQAIVKEQTLNANACISYLTIEHKGSIDIQYRRAIGNRIFGCDDCQLICPWNKFATLATVSDFNPRHQLDEISLLQIWQWSEAQFLKYTEGTPIRRTGYIGLLRNVAVALGNALHANTQRNNIITQSQNTVIITALKDRLGQSELLDEHINWALSSAN